MVGRTIDHLLQDPGDTVVTVVDGDGPDVDKDVKAQVKNLVQGEQEGVDVIGQTLKEAVHWVEGMAGKRCRDLPHMVGLVEVLVDELVVQEPMNPIDTHISE